jgi:hypothetical protein
MTDMEYCLVGGDESCSLERQIVPALAGSGHCILPVSNQVARHDLSPLYPPPVLVMNIRLFLRSSSEWISSSYFISIPRKNRIFHL